MSGTTRRLTVGTLMPAQGIHPREAQDALGAWVLQQVLDSPLQASTTDDPPVPRLLRSVPERQTSAGDTRYIAEVKSDITFSDGTPMTAQDVARSLASVAFFDRQVAVEATGDSVVFTLKREFARLDPASDPRQLRHLSREEWAPTRDRRLRDRRRCDARVLPPHAKPASRERCVHRRGGVQDLRFRRHRQAGGLDESAGEWRGGSDLRPFQGGRGGSHGRPQVDHAGHIHRNPLLQHRETRSGERRSEAGDGAGPRPARAGRALLFERPRVRGVWDTAAHDDPVPRLASLRSRRGREAAGEGRQTVVAPTDDHLGSAPPPSSPPPHLGGHRGKARSGRSPGRGVSAQGPGRVF